MDYPWEKVKSESTFIEGPSTESSFFANRASNFVLQNFSTYEIAHPCHKSLLGAVDGDGDYVGDDGDIYIMMKCLFVMFLFIHFRAERPLGLAVRRPALA